MPGCVRVISFLMNASYPRESGAEDCVIIVMELARGVSLFDILYFTDGFPEEVRLFFLPTFFVHFFAARYLPHKQNKRFV